MQLSKKADYAVRAMTILAGLPPARSLLAQDIADKGEIPIKFLEQILLILKRNDLVVSRRGVGGGYRLARASRLITLAEIIEAVDGRLLRFLDEDKLPDFQGSHGIQRCFSAAEDAANRLLREARLDDLVRVDAGDAMVGFMI